MTVTVGDYLVSRLRDWNVRQVFGYPGDGINGIVAALGRAGAGQGTTRPELMRRTDLGRTAVNYRAIQLINAGLVTEGPLGQSTGGRAPRELWFRADAGILLVAELGATSISAGIADLSGTLLDQRDENTEPLAGPATTLDRVAALFDRMLTERGDELPPVWGIGIGAGVVAVVACSAVGRGPADEVGHFHRRRGRLVALLVRQSRR